jgi:vacuolar protein sorting-associated protein 45
MMDVASAISGYVSKMVSVGDNPTGSSSAKMKILLLDSETVGELVSKGEA